MSHACHRAFPAATVTTPCGRRQRSAVNSSSAHRQVPHREQAHATTTTTIFQCCQRTTVINDNSVATSGARGTPRCHGHSNHDSRPARGPSCREGRRFPIRSRRCRRRPTRRAGYRLATGHAVSHRRGERRWRLMVRYAEIESHEHCMLTVGDGHEIHWDVSGNPHGKPPSYYTVAPARAARPAIDGCWISPIPQACSYMADTTYAPHPSRHGTCTTRDRGPIW